MRTRPPFFDSVREAAQNRWDQLERDRELGGAWWLLFRQVQNPRHVLSELLQNADDAGATEASATVEDGCFIFRHNGHDFSEDEFRSLCRFGFSNKRRLLTIGFRGIGFKSIFSLGSSVEVLTPTMTFGFDRQRFTQPEWVTTNQESDSTVIRIRIESPEKEKAIRTQIENWTASAAPLLFFQSIRALRLFDSEIQVENAGPGPCSNSQFVNLNGLEGRAIIFRSHEEPFPQDCLDEVRAERNEDIDLPPCEVVVFLGATQQQRLYCVLPTEVTLALPFSCHAPFVQDPARAGIKDPSISPTNAWLLDRVGELAAESFLAWLCRDDLLLSDRSKAYELLPELTLLNTALLSGVTTQRILDAFRKRINHEKLLLCTDGKLDTKEHSVRLPGAAIEAWGADGARSLFSPTKRSVLAREVSSGARSRLEAWQLLETASFDSLFKRLADESTPPPPRPERFEALAAFWAFAQRHLPAQWGWHDWWLKAAIVPISDRSHLGRAKDTLPSRSRPAECAPADWQFIVERANVLDQDWNKLIEFIKEEPRKAQRDIEDRLGRRVTEKDLAGIRDGFQKTKLEQAPRLDQIFEQVALTIFAEDPPDRNDAIKFLQLAASLDVSFADSAPIKFVCADGTWRTRADDLLISSDLDLPRLLPADWLSHHLISADYETTLLPNEVKRWRQWTSSRKANLVAFASPVKSETTGWNLNPAFFQARGVDVPQRRPSGNFSFIDWNWEPEILEHWRALERESGVSTWEEIGWAVVCSWSAAWDSRTTYQVHQAGYKYRYRLDNGKIPATWLHELRSRACIRDNRGQPRTPAELLRRTPETLALLDVEAFVHDRWDLPQHQSALEQLGVRGQATDASKLIERLRSLSRVGDPPLGPLRDLYRAIERVIARLTPDREKALLTAFGEESLIRTEAGWQRSGFCFRSNPGSIPGVSVLHSDIRDVIGLWEKLAIQLQPSAADALSWFASLPIDSAIADEDRTGARRVLELYPQDAWNREKRWLNLQGRVVATSSLRWGCLEPRAVPGLFASVRSEAADFSMLGVSRLQSVTSEIPRLIETAIERRILGYVPGPGGSVNEEPWLHTLGQVLSRITDEDASEAAVAADRGIGERMARTRWIAAHIVRMQPYLDGVPAGTQSELAIAWIAESLYVRGDSVRAYKSLFQEISRPFVTSTATAAIRDCVGREPNWIRAYADEYLHLAESTASVPRLVAESLDTEPMQPVSIFPDRGNRPDRPADQPTIPVKSDHKPEGQPPVPEQKTADAQQANASKEPTKFDRLTKFLATRGFCWDSGSERFLHSDGSFVRRCDGIFPWELVTSDRVNPLWLTTARFSDANGVEIPAEVWNAANRCPAILLSAEGGGYREHHFSTIRAELDAQTLYLYPSNYRIRVSGESDEACEDRFPH